jgi:hypothetical protein
MSTTPSVQSAATPPTSFAEILITAGGIVTSIMVVAANLVLARLLSFDLLSLSFWFVVPAGALIGGFAAAGGYFFVAKWTQTLPNRRILFNMVAVGLSTWLLYNWLDYYTLVLDDGTRVRDVASFSQYFTVTAEHMQLTIRTRANPSGVTTGELGSLGYAREALQALGFMAGGFATYAYLASSEVCDTCRRYTKVDLVLNAGAPESFDAILQGAGMTLPSVADDAVLALGKRRFAGLDLALLECPLCHSKWLRPAVVFQTGDSVDRERLGRYSVTHEGAQRVRQAAASLPKKK